MRKKLTIEPVGEKEFQRTLALPAMVEADPARTVKVATPVTGLVTELKVHLGDRVTKGQELAVIDSGDLAQAYSEQMPHVTGQQRADYGTTKQKLKPRRTWQAADG